MKTCIQTTRLQSSTRSQLRGTNSFNVKIREYQADAKHLKNVKRNHRRIICQHRQQDERVYKK